MRTLGFARIKEELKDFDGRKLFQDRYPITVPFDLSEPEKYLYDQVTKYINKYLGKAKGRKQWRLWLDFATTFGE